MYKKNVQIISAAKPRAINVHEQTAHVHRWMTSSETKQLNKKQQNWI